MSTIKDVADRANVSIATVSRVLNNNRYVSPDLRERVQQAIRDLKYEQNVMARNLRRNQSVTLGVIIPDATNPFFAEVTRGVEDVCFERGFIVILCNTSEDTHRAASYLSTLYQHRVAGIVLVTPGDLREELRYHIDKGDPLVLVDRPLPDVPADMVTSDNYGGGYQAIRHLVELGHRRIGLITGGHHLQTTKERYAGVQAALKAAAIPLEPGLVYEQGDYMARSGYEGLAALMQVPHPPTAVFAFNDLMALGALSYAYDHHIHIPDDLSIIGFDDIQASEFFVPALTTIAQPRYELGRIAAELLIDRILGNDHALTNERLPTYLVKRKTTAALVPVNGAHA
jgi:LacI family transcriptional regulator